MIGWIGTMGWVWDRNDRLDRNDPVIGSIGKIGGINARIVPILPIRSDLDPSDPTDSSDPITRPKTNPITPIQPILPIPSPDPKPTQNRPKNQSDPSDPQFTRRVAKPNRSQILNRPSPATCRKPGAPEELLALASSALCGAHDHSFATLGTIGQVAIRRWGLLPLL